MISLMMASFHLPAHCCISTISGYSQITTGKQSISIASLLSTEYSCTAVCGLCCDAKGRGRQLYEVVSLYTGPFTNSSRRGQLEYKCLPLYSNSQSSGRRWRARDRYSLLMHSRTQRFSLMSGDGHELCYTNRIPASAHSSALLHVAWTPWEQHPSLLLLP